MGNIVVLNPVIARLAGSVLVGLLVPTIVGAPVTQAGTAVTTSESAPVGLSGAAPELVRGFTAHCRERMAERGVGEPDVRMTVLLYRSTARYQPPQQTWLYVNRGSGLRVVLNDDGECVTVF